MFRYIKEEIKSIRERDPAARSNAEVFFLYSGFHALLYHRVANWLYRRNHPFLARWVSQRCKYKTGIEIHPAAIIGKGLFIDHGSGVVIGETSEIGDYVTIYQGVTLGGTGKDTGKRHPTIGDYAMIGSGARVLGPFRVGRHAKVAAGAVVLSEVPDDATAVGVPARVVKVGGIKVDQTDLDQVRIPDPIWQAVCQMDSEISELKQQLGRLKSGKNQKEEE